MSRRARDVLSTVPMLRRAISIVTLLALVRCGPAAAPATPEVASSGPAAGHPHAGPAQGHEPGHHERNSAGHGHSSGTANHRFNDPERWSKVFDDPKRDAWQKPDAVVAELRLAASDVVADIGAGTGYFAARLARVVPKGKVLAIDIEPKLIDFMLKRAEREGTANVEVILGSSSDPRLPSGVNVVLVVDTYHHIGERTQYFRRVRERLAPGGRVVIVDFKMGQLPVGPPDDHKLAPEVVDKEMIAAGYLRCSSFDGLPYQYMFTFAEKC